MIKTGMLTEEQFDAWCKWWFRTQTNGGVFVPPTGEDPEALAVFEYLMAQPVHKGYIDKNGEFVFGVEGEHQ